MKLLRDIKLFGLATITSLAAAPLVAAETYYTDQGHTKVQFGWNHAGVSQQYGNFDEVKGVLTLDPENVENSSLEVTISTNSLSTGFGPLDDHLKHADFLEVETYPEITFKSTSVEQTGETTANVMGDLTIRDVTQPATLAVTITHRGEHPLASAIDYYKGQWTAFSATTEIADHQAFNVGPFSTGPISISIVTEMKDRPD